MPNLKSKVSKALHSTGHAVTQPIVNRYHVVEARKIKEKQAIYDRENTPEVKAARNKAYAEATYENVRNEEKRKYEYKSQGGRAGQARRGISEGLTGLSLGSANALKNDMYGVGQVDFKGMDFLTMGGSPGEGTMRNLEDITGFGGPRPKPKQVNPMNQQGRGNIVINVGGSNSNRKRKPAAQVPKEKDWQDTVGELTGF